MLALIGRSEKGVRQKIRDFQADRRKAEIASAAAPAPSPPEMAQAQAAAAPNDLAAQAVHIPNRKRGPDRHRCNPHP